MVVNSLSKHISSHSEILYPYLLLIFLEDVRISKYIDCVFIFQLSEMTADLGEEHSAATLATERLEAEQAERMKLQKDNSELVVSI